MPILSISLALLGDEAMGIPLIIELGGIFLAYQRVSSEVSCQAFYTSNCLT